MADEELISLINGTDDNDKDDDKLSTQESADYQVTCKELVDLINKNDILEAIKERFDDIFGLVKALKSSTTNGIVTNPEELNTRKKIFGTNSIEQKPPKSIYRHIWEALSDTVLQILILCALISLIISFAIKDLREECIEGFAILFAVVIVTIVTALNNWQKEKQFLQLHKKINNEHVVSVVRNGIVVKLPLSELLVGDVCLVHNGDIVPADGILLDGNDLKVDESSLTGESQLVSKSKETPALLSGTRLMEGTGKYIITAVGVNSKSGSIMLLLGTSKESCGKKSELSKKDFKKQKKENREKDKSILQKKLAKLTIMVGWIGIFAAIVTVCVLILHFCIEHYYRKKEHWSNNHLMSYLRFIILGVTIMIVAIPEGLPLAVTISLAYSVKKMLVDNNLVRHLNACETMGRATTICSDKTGTLTTNRMTVVESYIQGFHYKQIPTQGTLKEEFLDLFCQCVSINSNYESRIKPPITLPSSVALSVADNGYYDQIGNKTECALLGFVLKLGKTYQQYRDQVSENNFIHVYTFNSNRKSMSTVINKPGGGFRMFSKGAAEILLEKCTQIINKDGNVEVLYKTDVDKLNQTVIVPMASNGLRIICIAYRDFPIDVNPDWKNEPSVLSDLICMAIVGIEDPIRPEVPSAIKKCQKAGITVRMITGDNISTAQSIAIKCGILEPNSNYLVIEGRDFNSKIRDDKGQIQQNLIDDLWPRIRVMARSSPEDKYNLVKGMIDSKLNYYGEVVAVTGDGTNDAPALKIADVGFAMGIQGTEVAKEASDIILTDDNFQSIVKAVMWGRNVYDSISKFIQFQLTVNLTAIFVSIIGSTTLSVSPLSAIQLLWVNLIMDSFASLALATEDPTDALLERKPYGRTKPLISRSMFRFILGHGLYQLVVMLVLIFYGHTLFKIPNGFDNKNHLPSEHLTILFNVFVMMQVFNEINARMVHGERNVFKNIFSSKLFIFIVVGTFVVQIFLVQFGGQAFSASPLNLNQWAWCLFIGYCELLWGQLIVTIPTAIKFKQRKKILFHK